MKKIVVIFVLLAAVLFADAQNWEWAVGFGSNQLDRSWDMAVSDNNEIVLTGRYSGDFQIGEHELPFTAQADFFIASFNENGAVNWARNISGNGEEIGIGVDCDSQGNVYAIGYFTDTVFVEGQMYVPQSWEVFVVSYDAAGNFRWFYQPHSDGYEIGYGISVSGEDHIYCTGWFQNYLAVTDSDTLYCYGSSDPFIIKLNSDGAVMWGQNFGGESVDYGFKIAADAHDNAYVTGVGGGEWTYGSEQFFKEPGMFVAKINPDKSLEWISDGARAGVNQIACDDYGHSWAAGRMTDTAQFGDYFFTTFEGSDDGYLAAAGTEGGWDYVAAIQSHGNVRNRDVAAHSEQNKNLAVAASFTDTLIFIENRYIAAAEDILIVGYSSQTEPLWALQAGGLDVDVASAIAFDQNGDILCSGWYSGSAEFGDIHLEAEHQYDMNFFIAKISAPQSVDEAKQLNTIKIQPNPVSTIASVYSNEKISSYRLLSIDGKQLLQVRTEVPSESIEIDLGNFPSGHYLLEINEGRQAANIIRK